MTDKIKEAAEKYAFRVPYDGSNNFYNEDRYKGFMDGATSEAAREYWVSSKDEEIARLKEGVKELVECLDLIVGSMSLERVERFELNEKAKSLIQKHEQ